MAIGLLFPLLNTDLIILFSNFPDPIGRILFFSGLARTDAVSVTPFKFKQIKYGSMAYNYLSSSLMLSWA
ncbi:MAG: hypothetical protein P8L49_02850 [Opitutaceae bacterium]|nr:hypothetical protein [Opitutaceae bacterium]